jgi:hypothetical protein
MLPLFNRFKVSPPVSRKFSSFFRFFTVFIEQMLRIKPGIVVENPYEKNSEYDRESHQQGRGNRSPVSCTDFPGHDSVSIYTRKRIRRH